MTLPTAAAPKATPDFVVVMEGADAVVGTVDCGEEAETFAPVGGFALAVAVLLTTPASTLAWVIV